MPRTRILHRLWIWAPVLVYVALIFYVSSLSNVPWGGLAPDFISHAIEYFGLAILVARGLNDGLSTPVPVRRLLLTFGICVAYAVTDEFHQMFVPHRYADVLDVLSDAVGAALALGALHVAQSVLARRGAA